MTLHAERTQNVARQSNNHNLNLQLTIQMCNKPNRWQAFQSENYIEFQQTFQNEKNQCKDISLLYNIVFHYNSYVFTLSSQPEFVYRASFAQKYLRLQQQFSLQVYWMAQETQILQLTGLSSEEIARRVLEILNQSRIDRFTVILRRSRLKPDSSHQPGSLLKLQGLNISTQKSYRTSHFAILHRSSSVSNNESITASYQTLSPLGMALRMYALGQYGQALDMLNTLKEQGETGKEVLIGIANCKFHLAHYEEAVGLYRSILNQHLSAQDRTSPEAAQLYNNLGSAYARLSLQKPSMNAFSQAIEIYHMHPQMDCSPLYSNIAGIYLKAGMPEAAEGYYLKALAEKKAKRPSQRELLLHCYRRLAKAQARMGKYQDAESQLAKASKLAQSIGGLEETLKEEAALREEQGKWQEAIDFYQKLHVLHEEQGEDENGCKGQLYQNASRVYNCMGKWTEYRKYLEKAVNEYRKSGNLAKLNELQNSRKLQGLTQSIKGNR